MDNRFARRSAGAGDFWEGEKMSELIDRQEAIEACMKYNGQGYIWSLIMKEIKQLPPIQPTDNLQKLADEIASFKRCVKSENSDYLTGYLSALSVVEGMIADMREVTT